MRRALPQAVLTGVFCMAFAVVVDAVTDRLALYAVLLVSFGSGFLGSLCAQMVLRRSDREGPTLLDRDELE